VEREELMASLTLTCKYCGASNPAGTSRCVSCGAPIDLPSPTPVSVTTVTQSASASAVSEKPDTTPQQISDALDAAPINDQLKEGLKAVGTGAATLGVGTFVARTTAEAASIALSAFLIAFFSAASRSFGLALLGGIVVGLLVGFVVKRPWAVLISAPAGTILGLVAGHFIQAGSTSSVLQPLLGMVGGGVLALIGGKGNGTNVAAKWYGRFRPFLGMMGGFLFALLGYAIGRLVY
jgi:hypothetical protein